MPCSVLGLFVVVVAFLGTYHLTVIASDCPLDLGWSNFSLAASVCSNQNERGKCCRYINAFVAVSVTRYANTTGKLGVPSAFSQMCVNSVSQTLELHGIPSDAMVFCGLGRKILVTYQCEGRTSILEMLQSPNFSDVIKNCKMPLSTENNCRRCLNSGIVYLHHLIGAEDNVTLSTCRDAAFVALANQGDNMSSVDLASCFFGVQGLNVLPMNISGPSESVTPGATPGPVSAKAPSQHLIGKSMKEHHHTYHLTLIPVLGIVVTGVAVILLIVLTLLIRRKNRELNGAGSATGTSWKGFTYPPVRKSQEGPPSMFRRFSYKETMKASSNFCSIIGRGGFGTVYKAEFGDGFVAAVKRMNKVSGQDEDEFCREMELLGRLHHRHLVSLKGFCVAKHERFLLYEYMANGSLKDNLHSSGKTPLSWQTRIQIAIDVANALEYLHFYCDPPLCHRDIKSSNILLDENFIAKVADFGLAHASRSGSISFEPVNTDIRGTPGYMDPEYVATQELTEKSDVYSYGVLLLELVTGRLAIQDNKNLVEWSQKFMVDDTKLPEMVDPVIAGAVDSEQLQVVVWIIQWCTQREGRARPSIKQVLRMLYERLDPLHQGFAMVMEEEEEDEEGRYGGGRNGKGKSCKGEMIPHSGDARCLPSSSSTSRSYCSRSFLLETGSPQSPPNGLSI